MQSTTACVASQGWTRDADGIVMWVNANASCLGAPLRAALATINCLGAPWARHGSSWLPLRTEVLLETAMRQTGLADFGDNSFRPAFATLVQALANEARLSVVGRISVHRELLHLLANRLAIIRDLSRQPEILTQPVQRPLFIVGLPRTGTTLLHNLLATNPLMRAPRLWELRYPALPPHWERQPHDPRRRATTRMVHYLNLVLPQLRVIHPLEALAPDECLHIFYASFMCVMFDCFAAIDSYITWLLQQDMSPAYRFYRQTLQRLQWNAPPVPWIVKSPLHLLSLDQVLATFPDARIAFLHRDPVQVAASGCSLLATTRMLQNNVIERRRLGPYWLETWGTAMERAMAVRQRLTPEHFYDLHYDELLSNAPRAACRLLASFNYPMPPDLMARMQQWLAAHPQHQYGVHRYALTPYNVTAAQITARFAPYLEHYRVSSQYSTV